MKNEYKGLCPQCQDDEIYSEKLTNGLCLDCYNNNEYESRLVEIECMNDEGEKMNKVLDGVEAKKLFVEGEARLEYLDQYGKWQIFDFKFHRADMFKFYDKWRVY